MKLTRHSATDRKVIQRYGGGGFSVSNVKFQGSLIVTSSNVTPWNVTSLDAISLADFQPLIALAKTIDVCLLGCGSQMQPLPPEIRIALKDAGLTVDPMNTKAACRTFNVLTGEGRAVVAALIAI